MSPGPSGGGGGVRALAVGLLALGLLAWSGLPARIAGERDLVARLSELRGRTGLDLSLGRLATDDGAR